MKTARKVLEGVGHKESWRVIEVEREDQHGIPRTEYIIETSAESDVDRLGVRRWRELNDKSGWSDWRRMADYFLDIVLKAREEAKNATHR